MLSEQKLTARFQFAKLGAAYTWDVAKARYDKILQEYKIIRFNAAAEAATRITPFLPLYKAVSIQTNVPVVWLAATNERESSTRFNTYFGNGDPLNHVTRDVPKGRGPFPTWNAGCLDALHQMNLIGLPNWTLDFCCYQWERYNGFGYEEFHNEISPYVVGGTSLQTRGKYDADGHFNPNVMDTQLGCLAIYAALIAQIPDLALPTYG